MNDKYIKEYEEMSLCDFADELVEPLCTIKKDLTKAIYIRYAEERDKNDELEQENEQLKDNWNKLKEIAKSQSGFKKRADLKGGLWFEVDDLLDKIQEIEGSDK